VLIKVINSNLTTMIKPSAFDFGYESPTIDNEGGWVIEGGEEAYQEALEMYEKSVSGNATGEDFYYTDESDDYDDENHCYVCGGEFWDDANTCTCSDNESEDIGLDMYENYVCPKCHDDLALCECDYDECYEDDDEFCEDSIQTMGMDEINDFPF